MPCPQALYEKVNFSILKEVLGVDERSWKSSFLVDKSILVEILAKLAAWLKGLHY